MLFYENGRGKLAYEVLDLNLPNKVLHSNCGWYIGTEDGEGPCSRESEEYYDTYSAADKALKTKQFTQRWGV